MQNIRYRVVELKHIYFDKNINKIYNAIGVIPHTFSDT
jgi:hypothetical protein